MVGRFAPRVLVAFVAAPVGPVGIVQELARRRRGSAAAATPERRRASATPPGARASVARRPRVRRARSPRAIPRPIGEEAVAAAARPAARACAAGCARLARAARRRTSPCPRARSAPRNWPCARAAQLAPRLLERRQTQPFELAQEPDPERLDLDRVALARRAGGMVRVHPREMARAEHERRSRDPPGCRWECRADSRAAIECSTSAERATRRVHGGDW